MPGRRRPSPRRRAAVLVGVLLIALLADCTQLVTGGGRAVRDPAVAAARPVARPTPPPPSPDEIGDVAAEALQGFWRERFPAEFGRPWTDLAAFVPVRTAQRDAPAPPCLRRAADLADQALYCPAADAVAWDADRLLPAQVDQFGAAGAVVVLAHEIGHAVQHRLGIDRLRRREPARYPTILVEAMADCFAGTALRDLVDHPVTGLPIGLAERDLALQALVGFRDPLGVDPGDAGAHGNAFDRVWALQTGYADGPGRCAAMSTRTQVVTQRRFGSREDRAGHGDLPFEALLGQFEQPARDWFTAVGASRSAGWQAPPLGRIPAGAAGCPEPASAEQGPARYCAATGAIWLDPAELAAVHRQFGDFAAVVELASRYGLATLQATGGSPTGPAAGAAAVCLSGAYTAQLLDGPGFALSPGDLDEAVEVLLAGDWPARDADGRADPAEHGFDRVARFRGGVFGGPRSCLPTR